ncbi:MAG: hypothetical protein KDD37_11135, partial [Bdellovibrionales bacterium]|nr:hypothetical protein [Bdellovibrionales bacterium]
YMELNYLEQISHFMGSFMPYERGERFIEEWNARFKETQPKDFKTLNHNSPAGELLRKMLCPTDKKLIEQNKILGSLTFNPPAVVKGDSKKYCVTPFVGMLDTDFIYYNLRSNQKLGEAINYIITDSRPEIFGEAPSALQNFANTLTSYISGPLVEDTALEKFLIQFKTQMQGGPNHFVQWWDNNIESEITKKFVEITGSYNEGIQKNLADLINSYNGSIDLNRVPDTLTESYLAQTKVYLDYILSIYTSRQSDTGQVELAKRLRDEILGSMNLELKKAIDLSIDKDEITTTHAETLALLKKFKSLIQAPDLISKSSWMTSKESEAVEFRDSLNYYRELLSPDNARSLSMEWVNELEARVKQDDYMNQAFREALKEVSKNYESLKPVYFSSYIRGTGIQPVKELFNFLASITEEVYQLTKLTRLTTSSNYMEMDDKGVERRGKGSRKGF